MRLLQRLCLITIFIATPIWAALIYAASLIAFEEVNAERVTPTPEWIETSALIILMAGPPIVAWGLVTVLFNAIIRATGGKS